MHKGCGNGSTIVFTPDGKGKITNDTKCIEQVQQIMASTRRFDIVYDRGAYVLDVDVNDGVYVNDDRRNFESDSGICLSVIRKEHCERALNHAQKEHERKESIQQDVHGEDQNTFEHVKLKVPPKPCEPTKWNISPMKPHIVRFVHGVRSASRPRDLTENTPNKWRIPSTFL